MMSYIESPHYPNLAAGEQRAMIEVIDIHADELTKRIQIALNEGHFFNNELIGVPLVPQNASKPGSVPHEWRVNFRLLDDVMSLRVYRHAGWPEHTGTLHAVHITDNCKLQAIVDRFGRLNGQPPVTLIEPIDTIFATRTPEADLLATRPRVLTHIDGAVDQLLKRPKSI